MLRTKEKKLASLRHFHKQLVGTRRRVTSSATKAFSGKGRCNCTSLHLCGSASEQVDPTKLLKSNHIYWFGLVWIKKNSSNLKTKLNLVLYISNPTWTEPNRLDIINSVWSLFTCQGMSGYLEVVSYTLPPGLQSTAKSSKTYGLKPIRILWKSMKVSDSWTQPIRTMLNTKH